VSDWQERLSEAMDARGISGGELGRRTGFTAQYINSMRSKERGARLTLDTARRIAQALGISVEWLTAGTGRRERLSDVYPVYVEPDSSAGPPESAMFVERYPGRAEAIALLATTVEPEVIAALRAAVPPEPEVDPGRAHWIDLARELAHDFQQIKADPTFRGEGAPPTSEHAAPTTRRAPPTTGRKKAK
jgi:transcriptional regulator with XRE-family HTH domain